MHKIKEMLMEELYEYEEKAKKMSGGKVSAGDLEALHKLTDTVKNIDKIEMLEGEDGYSEDGGNYGGGSSYRRGRGRNARRDSMGRYSSAGGYGDGQPMGRQGTGRYTGRYSRESAKEHMIDKLEEMLEIAGGDKERRAIEHCINQIENA